MKKSIYLTLCLTLVIAFTSYAQTASPDKNAVKKTTVLVKEEKSLEERMEGTYEIINTNNKVQYLFTTETLEDIERRRKETLDVYYEISPYVTIKIYSKNYINSPDFNPKKN